MNVKNGPNKAQNLFELCINKNPIDWWQKKATKELIYYKFGRSEVENTGIEEARQLEHRK